MANILNADVLFGQNALTNPSSFLNQINSVTINNGVFQHVNVVNDYDPNIGTDQPEDWTDNTILNATFEDGVGGGDTGNLINVANQMLIKRREVGVYTNIGDGWLTIARIPFETSSDLQFVVYDYTCKCNTQYEYVFIPTLIQNQGGVDVQVETSITENSTRIPVMSEFDKIYISTTDGNVALYAGTSYDSTNTERLTGVHQTLGSQYPIVVTNSTINYHSGGVQGTILNKNYGHTNPITGDMTELNRQQIIEARKEFDSFITQGVPMTIKDWNGNIWLVMITDSPSYSWFNEWGMGLGSVSFQWTEIGDMTNQQDLEKAGMVYTGGDE